MQHIDFSAVFRSSLAARWVCFAKIPALTQMALFRQNPLEPLLALFSEDRPSLPLALFRQIHTAVFVALFGQRGTLPYPVASLSQHHIPGAMARSIRLLV